MLSDKQAVALSSGMNIQEPANAVASRSCSHGTYLLGTAVIIALLFAQMNMTYATASGATPDRENEASTAEQEGTLQDIIVTARRISEPLQRTPVAVTALTADQLQ